MQSELFRVVAFRAQFWLAVDSQNVSFPNFFPSFACCSVIFHPFPLRIAFSQSPRWVLCAVKVSERLVSWCLCCCRLFKLILIFPIENVVFWQQKLALGRLCYIINNSGSFGRILSGVVSFDRDFQQLPLFVDGDQKFCRLQQLQLLKVAPQIDFSLFFFFAYPLHSLH